MSRRRPLTEAEAQHLQAQARGERTPDAIPTPGSELRFVFTGKVYNLNRDNRYIGRLKGSMRQAALRQFGKLPPGMCCQWPAEVLVIRVLGPRQRMLDGDKNLQVSVGPLVDALVQGGWLYDDRPKWATFRFKQDEGRRDEGPCIEFIITYNP